jgi:hypothetical protein
MKQSAVFLVLLVILAACGSNEAEPPTVTPAPPPTPTEDVIPVEDRLAIETNYETLRQLHAEISGIWEALARNENAQCGTEFPIMPSREDLTGYGEISDHLLRAASELRAAGIRWESECANPRENVPQQVIEAGLLEVRAAGDALREVESFLAE